MGIAFIDSAAHPIAVKYYQKVKGEPIKTAGQFGTIIWESFGRTIELPNMNLRKLLASMAGSIAPGSNSGGLVYPAASVLICCHGTQTQLAMPVDSGGANVYTESIKLLEQCQKLNSTATDYKASVADYALRLKISADALKGILADLKKVQALGIDHVAFRACNIGNTPMLLAALKRLFNAGSISAPNVYDAYNNFNPKTAKDAKAFDKYLKENPQALIDGTTPDRMAIVTREGSKKGGWKIEGLAESSMSLPYWYNRKYGLSEMTPQAGVAFPIHAMVLDKITYGVVFPGDKEYMSRLIYWIKSEASYLD